MGAFSCVVWISETAFFGTVAYQGVPKLAAMPLIAGCHRRALLLVGVTGPSGRPARLAPPRRRPSLERIYLASKLLRQGNRKDKTKTAL